MSRIFVGFDTSFVHDLPATLDEVYEDKINGIAAPLFHPRFKRDDHELSDLRDGPQTRSDLVMDSRGWTASVVGNISKYIDLDATTLSVRLSAEKIFKQEVAWASHLSVRAVMLPSPRHVYNSANYARVLNQSLTQAQYLQFWVRIPLTTRQQLNVTASMELDSEAGLRGSAMKTDEGKEDAQIDPWDTWDALRARCEYHPKLHVALEITADLPSTEEIQRWLGESVKAAIIPMNIFLTNRKGFPTLSQRHQKLMAHLFQHNIQFYLSGRPRHRGKLLPYVQYLHFLYSKRPNLDRKAQFEAPYLDYLQAPLQPLMDNLESQTYETFEQDAFKYNQYEKAITLALAKTREDKESVVMVVGAGRGPLVRSALRAALAANRKTRMFAVEKNPNAVITLRNLKTSEKWDNVTIVASDMRNWRTDERADIMVSELLGSFGDNELSPECLDGAQNFLQENGISIPCEYTSYVTPVMSSKLWNEVKVQDSLKSFETPYVVRLHNFYALARTQKCFTFTHPKFHGRIDNRRQAELRFTTTESAVVHGVAGYFDAVLFEDVTLSIEPELHSDGMFSWFPIFFPLRQPLRLEKGDDIVVSFWRLESSNRVWYEWSVSTGDGKRHNPIHNPNVSVYE
ncbi:protein arginine n [Plasmopara halstedii]|uniref:Protein arginine N-methyltransferase n=1 Tax=Plasmopara halstedii TaxID=4781 RepID=A0A0N7L4E9_PLAHL|nr:protein arginine n [Plasmopara halstedii]CEG38483.1 protein arginine n [Plasmopara halstedii]|eukprot:XP_024574852.1 protein arginine n [Plasmopara halstedii]